VVHRNRGGAWLIALTLVVGIAGVASFLLRRQLESPDAAVEAGKADFARYCAECHGSDGRGTGPRAEQLARRPADLTLLAERSGGTFRAPDIRDFIDGRGFEAAHQDREMPIWGNLLSGQVVGGTVDPETARRVRLEHLVAYIWSLQRSSSPSRP
jgi:mono/diheme cytochrome c family protein